MNKIVQTLAACFALLPAVSVATLPNTIAANAIAYEVGQGWVSHHFDESVQTRWFTFGETARHSYCVEVVPGSATGIQLDPSVTVYSGADGATVLVDANGTTVQNSNGGGDPNFIKGARICYLSPSPGTTNPTRSFKVTVPIAAGSGDSGFVRIRVTNTTMFASCALDPTGIGPGGMLHNASGSSIVYWVWLVPTGGQASQMATSAGNASAYGTGSLYYQPVFAAPNTWSTCFLAHTAPPGTVSAWINTHNPMRNENVIQHFKAR